MHPAATAGFTRRRAGLCFSRRTLCLPETGVALSVRPTEMNVLESVMQWKKRRKPPLGAKEVKTLWADADSSWADLGPVLGCGFQRLDLLGVCKLQLKKPASIVRIVVHQGRIALEL
jgi:hypothetical protein